MSKSKKVVGTIIIILILIIIALLVIIMVMNVRKNNQIALSENDSLENSVEMQQNTDEENEIEDFDFENVVDEYHETANQEEQIENSDEIDNDEDVEIARGLLYETRMIPTEQMVIKYLSNFQYNIDYHIDSAYNLLDDELKNKIGSLEDFSRLVEENREFFDDIVIANYSDISLESKDDINIYTFVDESNRKYTIKEKAVMKYTINIEE